MLAQNTLRTSFQKNVTTYATVYVNNCLEQFELPHSLQACALYSKGSRKRNFFILKIAGNEFWHKKILHKIFGLKEPYFLQNIATNLSKNNDFANSLKKRYFFLLARPLPPPPLLVARPLKKITFFAASLSL